MGRESHHHLYAGGRERRRNLGDVGDGHLGRNQPGDASPGTKSLIRQCSSYRHQRGQEGFTGIPVSISEDVQAVFGHMSEERLPKSSRLTVGLRHFSATLLSFQGCLRTRRQERDQLSDTVVERPRSQSPCRRNGGGQDLVRRPADGEEGESEGLRIRLLATESNPDPPDKRVHFVCRQHRISAVRCERRNGALRKLSSQRIIGEQRIIQEALGDNSLPRTLHMPMRVLPPRVPHAALPVFDAHPLVSLPEPALCH